MCNLYSTFAYRLRMRVFASVLSADSARLFMRKNERWKGNCVCSPQRTFDCKLSDDSNSYTSCHLCDRRERQREREGGREREIEREYSNKRYVTYKGKFSILPAGNDTMLIIYLTIFVLTEQCSGFLYARVIVSWRLGWTYRLHPKGYECYNSLLTLRMKAVLFFKMSRRNYRVHGTRHTAHGTPSRQTSFLNSYLMTT